MRKWILIFVAVLVASHALAANAKKKPAKSFLPRTFRAKFQQKHISTLTGKEKVSSGVIEYQYPGNIRFEVKKPNHIIFVSNPKKTWYYTGASIEGEAGELTIKPTGKMVLSRFFDTLKQGLKSNKLYGVKKVNGKERLTFTPAAMKKMGIKEATLTFGKKGQRLFKDLKQVDLLYKNKKKVTMILTEIKSNLRTRYKEFFFRPPPNTKIIK